MNALEATALLHGWQSLARGATDTGGWASVLAEFSVFAGVRRRRLRKLVSQATVFELMPGDTVAGGPAPDQPMYIILGGRARSRARMLTAGDVFGDLSDLGTRTEPSSLVAIGEVHVMRVPRASFLRLVRQEPSVSVAMLTDLCARLHTVERIAQESL